MAQAAGISQLDIHLLVNRSLPGAIAGYITRDGLLGDHLRNQQELIWQIILGAAKTHGRSLAWINRARISDLPDIVT